MKNNFYLFLILLICFIKTANAAKSDCTKNFAELPAKNKSIEQYKNVSKFVFTKEVLKEIEKLKKQYLKYPDSFSSLMRNQEFLQKQPPEFWVGLLLETTRFEDKTSAGVQVRHALSPQALTVTDPHYDHIIHGKINFENVPESYRTRWVEIAKKASKKQTAKLKGTKAHFVNLKDLIIYLNNNPELTRAEKESLVPLIKENIVKRDSFVSLLHGLSVKDAAELNLQAVRRDLLLSDEPTLKMNFDLEFGAMEINLYSTEKPEMFFYRTTDYRIYKGSQEIKLPEVRRTKVGNVVTEGKKVWKVQDKKLYSHYKVRLINKKSIYVPKLKKLDYESMWKDKSLTGLIAPGSNMVDILSSMMSEYKMYFQENGFKFRNKIKVKDFKEFLKKEIESGSLDYLVKEAHLEEYHGAVATFDSTGTIQEGIKKLPGGKTERVFLYYPDRTKPDPTGKNKVLVLEKDFSDWFKVRESKSKNSPQLLYLNTTCHDLVGMCRLAETVASPKLVLSGADSTADTFTNENETALVHILDGVRNKKSFGEIREKMMENSPSYRDGEENTYRFPDDEEWNEEVRNRVYDAFEVEIETVDEKGNPIPAMSWKK